MTNIKNIILFRVEKRNGEKIVKLKDLPGLDLPCACKESFTNYRVYVTSFLKRLKNVALDLSLLHQYKTLSMNKT